MLDARASFNDLLSNVDSLLESAGKMIVTSKIAAAKTAEDEHEAIASAVDAVTSTARTAVDDLHKAAAARQQKRAEKVELAKHIYRTALRLAV
jgi:hypothetical protein